MYLVEVFQVNCEAYQLALLEISLHALARLRLFGLTLGFQYPMDKYGMMLLQASFTTRYGNRFSKEVRIHAVSMASASQATSLQ